jgi:hypothetical protein
MAMSGDIIMFVKSPTQLDRDWLQLITECRAEHEKICREDDVLKAFIAGDSDILAKSTSSEIELAKSQAANFARSRSEDLSSLFQTLGRIEFTNGRLEDWGRNAGKLFEEHNRLRARSKRFLRRIGADR